MLMRTHKTHHARWWVARGLCHTADYEINANTGSDSDHCEEDKHSQKSDLTGGVSGSSWIYKLWRDEVMW